MHRRFAAHVSTLLWVLCMVSLVLGEEEKTPTFVVDLTNANFDEMTKEGKWLIEFYAPWCGHCKKLEPIYDEASVILNEAKSELKLGKVDCTVETDLSTRFNIKGFPTLKYIRSGITTGYESGRTLNAILEFGNRVSGPAVHDITAENFQDFKVHNAVAMVLVGGSDIADEVFTTVAKKLQDTVGFGRAPASLKKDLFPFEGDSFVVLLSDDDPFLYDGPFTEEDLTAFGLKYRYPLFSELGPHNFHSLTNSGKLTVVVGVDMKDSQTFDYLLLARTVAKKFKANFTFGYIDAVEYSQFVNRHGVNVYPNFFVLDTPGEQFYSADSIKLPHTVESVSAFLQDIVDGKVAPIKSGGIAQLWMFIQGNPWLIVFGVVIVTAAIGMCFYLSTLNDEAPKEKKQ